MRRCTELFLVLIEFHQNPLLRLTAATLYIHCSTQIHVLYSTCTDEQFIFHVFAFLGHFIRKKINHYFQFKVTLIATRITQYLHIFFLLEYCLYSPIVCLINLSLKVLSDNSLGTWQKVYYDVLCYILFCFVISF